MASNNNQNEAPNTGSTIHISETFFDKYKKAIIYGVVAVIVIVAGAIIYNNYVAAPRAEKASTALAKGQEYFGMEEYTKALNGDSIGYAGFIKIAAEQHRRRQPCQPIRRTLLCAAWQMDGSRKLPREIRHTGRPHD